ncbi:MAG TPA: hypothetical protein VMU26_14060 [Candidatus Polarisedimenticolia bacterium]|nr:hypothetical protein [Candidatus Polarisedimenticolia bacterium]
MSTIDKNYTASAHSERWVFADLLLRDEPDSEDEDEEEDDDGEHEDEDEDSGYSE